MYERRLFNFALAIYERWLPKMPPAEFLHECRLFRQHHHHIVGRISFENKQYEMVFCVYVRLPAAQKAT